MSLFNNFMHCGSFWTDLICFNKFDFLFFDIFITNIDGRENYIKILGLRGKEK